MTHPDATLELECPDCGYNLFGIASERCPECGLAIDRSKLGESRIPWTHRQAIGRVRGFLRTVKLVILHPRKFAKEINRPVLYQDARSFRHICMLMAGTPLWVWALLGTCLKSNFLGTREDLSIAQKIIASCLFAPAIWLGLWIITGFPSIFFRPRAMPVARQNRAVALSIYAASAPWALAGIIGWLGVVAFFCGDRDLAAPFEVLAPIIAVSVLIFPLLLIHCQWEIFRGMTQPCAGRQILFILGVIFSWILYPALILSALAVATYVYVAIQSMRGLP